MQGVFRNTKKEGAWKEYYEDGSLKAHYNFKNGVLDGKQYGYGPTGTLLEEKNYENGNLTQ